jgi:hypothetical protein
LCSNGDPGKPSTPIKVELKPNSAKTVTFPIIPLRNGLYPVNITAITTEIGLPSVDVVEKKLYVVVSGLSVFIIKHYRSCTYRKHDIW